MGELLLEQLTQEDASALNSFFPACILSGLSSGKKGGSRNVPSYILFPQELAQQENVYSSLLCCIIKGWICRDFLPSGGTDTRKRT